MKDKLEPDPSDLAAYFRRYPGAEARGKKIMAKIAERDSRPRHASGSKRNYTSSLQVAGIGGAATNTRGAAIAGKKRDGK